MEKPYFDRLYQENSGRIYGILLRITRNPETAKDLTQETFLSIYTHLEDFRGESKIETWIHRIARNKAFNYLEREKNRRKRFYETKMLTEDRRPENAYELLALKERELAFTRETLRLNKQQRRTLEMRMQGKKLRDISEKTGSPKGTISYHLYAIREKMRPALSEY